MSAAPTLYGLVLAGGRSRRFGSDKAALRVDGDSLLKRTVELLAVEAECVYVSARPDQADDLLRATYSMICDDDPGLGPAGGLLAAHRRHAEVAWLVAACDMPGLDGSILQILVQSRNARRAATAFRSPVDGKVEPLCAIYEPATLARLSQRTKVGRGLSPRDLLGDSDVEYVELADPAALTNVNTPTDLETWHASPSSMSDEGTE